MNFPNRLSGPIGLIAAATSIAGLLSLLMLIFAIFYSALSGQSPAQQSFPAQSLFRTMGLLALSVFLAVPLSLSGVSADLIAYRPWKKKVNLVTYAQSLPGIFFALAAMALGSSFLALHIPIEAAVAGIFFVVFFVHLYAEYYEILLQALRELYREALVLGLAPHDFIFLLSRTSGRQLAQATLYSMARVSGETAPFMFLYSFHTNTSHGPLSLHLFSEILSGDPAFYTALLLLMLTAGLSFMSFIISVMGNMQGGKPQNG